MEKAVAIFVVGCLVVFVGYPTAVLLGFNPIGLSMKDLDNAALALFLVMLGATTIGELMSRNGG